MSRRRVNLVIVLVICTVIGLTCPPCIKFIEMGPAGFHQVSVKNELADWEREYAVVRDWPEAVLTVGMMEYVQEYYVPGPGYRGSARTEAEVEAQRSRTLDTMAAALRMFTGQDFGRDVARWRQWLAEQGHAKQ